MDYSKIHGFVKSDVIWRYAVLRVNVSDVVWSIDTFQSVDEF